MDKYFDVMTRAIKGIFRIQTLGVSLIMSVLCAFSFLVLRDLIERDVLWMLLGYFVTASVILTAGGVFLMRFYEESSANFSRPVTFLAGLGYLVYCAFGGFIWFTLASLGGSSIYQIILVTIVISFCIFRYTGNRFSAGHFILAALPLTFALSVLFMLSMLNLRYPMTEFTPWVIEQLKQLLVMIVALAFAIAFFFNVAAEAIREE